MIEVSEVIHKGNMNIKSGQNEYAIIEDADDILDQLPIQKDPLGYVVFKGKDGGFYRVALKPVIYAVEERGKGEFIEVGS